MKEFIKEHPTFLITFSYFSIMVIGVTYSFFFYTEFDINIIKFVDLSDFLLAPILEPLSILIFVAWGTVGYRTFKAANANPVNSLKDE